MKIVSLQAENIKRLIAVEIRPDGNLVQITGKNGQGKTSVLDSILWALGGLGKVQMSPVRMGQEEGRIHLDLGEIRVIRTFRTRDDGNGGRENVTSSLTVTNADGSKFPSPQAMLDSFLGALSFDPLAFARMEARDQFKTLARFVPGVDFDAIERANKADYDRRTDLNRRARESLVLAEKITVPADGPTQPVDESALIDQLEAAAKTNADIQQRRNNRTLMSDKAMKARAEATRLIEEAAAIEKRLAEAPPLPDPVDVTALRQQIAEAQEVNADVARRITKDGHLLDAKKYSESAKALTAQMDAREADKRDKIASANLPVPGLGFGDGFITLNGVPFNQASDAEQLRASIAIAMASNPRLRVLRVRDGSLLDDGSMALLDEMAKERDFQVWIEKVGEGGVGFVLEDGHIKAQKTQKPEPSTAS